MSDERVTELDPSVPASEQPGIGSNLKHPQYANPAYAAPAGSEVPIEIPEKKEPTGPIHSDWRRPQHGNAAFSPPREK